MTPSPAPRRLLRLVLALTLACAAAPAARAQEGGEAGAPPTEPATMDNAIEQIDAKRNVAIKLPREWKSVRYEGDDRAVLATFRGFFTPTFDGLVELRTVPWSLRAVLAMHVDLASEAPLIPELTRTGPGFAEGAILARNVAFRRYLEKDGVLYAATVYSHGSAKDTVKDIAQKILETFRVTAKPPAPPAPPAHLTARKSGDFDLWTDAKKDDANLAKTMEFAEAARGFMVKAMGKQKPFDESRPVLRAYSAGDKYEDDIKPILGAAPEHGGYEFNGRAVIVPLYKLNRPETPPAIYGAAAEQYVVQYFGGRPPIFVEHGLTYYGVIGAEAGGKPQKPTPERISATNSKCAGKRTLMDWINVKDGKEIPDTAVAVAEMGAWHWFIRHGPGKKYRKQYDAYLDALRANGDVLAAKKAWDGVDFDAMKTEFVAWYPTWAP